ncbi:MAG TPA: LamG domain-containing protein [Polyangiaceae bacterium]
MPKLPLAFALTAALWFGCTLEDPPKHHNPFLSGAVGGAGGQGGSAGSTATGGASGSATVGTATSGGGGSTTTGGAAGSGGSSEGTDAGSTDAASDRESICAGHALQFNGGGTYGTINRIVQDDFTFEAWIKTSVTSPLAGSNFWEGYGLIYADVTSTVNDFGSSILNGKFAFGVGNPDTTIQSTSLVTSGQWIHVAATRRMSTGQIQVFVNGNAETTVTPAQTQSLTAPMAITIGGNTINSRYFGGTMDELRFWNVVRTGAEITEAMHQRLTGNEAGLVGYWHFDEASGSTAADSSPTKANLALTGAPAFVPSDAPLSCP